MSRISYPIITPKTLRQKCGAYLLSNGVKCVIVQDPTATMSAAAMSIHAGQLNDPADLPGLAHFCEHMLFMGSEKYPQEDEYSSFISKSGGTDNAWTSDNATTFYLKVSDDALQGALERFVEFFVAPLFDAGSVEREVNAVHSEDEKNHNVDYWRADEILRSLYNPKHPRFRYGNGNQTTLVEEPRAKGIDVRTELRHFYDKHYLSKAACIAVLSSRSPEDVLAIIEAPLLRMRSGPAPSFRFLAESDSLFAPEHLGTWINVRSVKKLRSVQLLWVVRSAESMWRSLPHAYLSHVLGHECDSSVLGVLKRRNLATKMSAGPRPIDDDYHLFNVTVGLTAEGMRHIVDVIALVYAGIGHAIANGVDRRVYDEMKAEDRLQFESSEIGDSTSFCASIATSACVYGLEHSWIGGECILVDDLDATLAYAKQLRPENCVVMFAWGDLPLDVSLVGDAAAAAGSEANEEDEEAGEEEEEVGSSLCAAVEGSKESAEAMGEHVPSTATERLLASLPAFARVPANQQARFHKAAYSQVSIPADIMCRWSDALAGPYDADLALPKTNPYIAKDFTVFCAALPEGSHTLTSVKTTATASGTVCVRADAGHHRTFKSCITTTLLSPVAYKTPSNRVYLRILKSILQDHLTELSYFGELASLENSIDMPATGLSFAVDGPHESLLHFFSTLLQKSLDADALLSTKEKFAVYAETAQRALASIAFKQPYEMALDRFTKLSKPLHYSYDDLLGPASEVTYEGYRHFVDEYVHAGALFESFMAGNIPDVSTMPDTVAKLVGELLSARSVPTKTSIPRSRDGYRFAGREGLNIIAFPPFNEADPNVAVLLSICAGVETPRLRALCDCATKLVASLFFAALRTKEALGYIVFARTKCEGQHAHVQFTVQSALEDVDGLYLLSRIIAFLDAVEAQIDTVCREEDVQKVVKGLVAARERLPNSVNEDAMRLQTDYLHPCGPQHRDEEVQCLKQICCADVKQFLLQTILNGRKNVPAIALIVNNKRTAQEESFLNTEERIICLPQQRAMSDSQEEDIAPGESKEGELSLPSYAGGERALSIKSWRSIAEFQAGLSILKDETF